MTALHAERPATRERCVARRKRVAMEVLRGEYAGDDPPWVYPVEPFARQVALVGGFRKAGAELFGMRYERLERAWYRGLEAGYLTWKEADALAVEVLGVHPFAVWGDVWFGGPPRS